MPNDGTLAAPEVREGTPGRTLVLAACVIATFMAAVESTIVATTIPTIVGELGGFDLFSWVFTIFLLTQAVSIPVYGRLADIFGRKPVFFVGVGLFLTGSTLCGLAWNMPSLVLFRAIEGFGAGAIQPIAATILGDIYTPTERAKIQGLISSVFGVAAVVGPSMGAFLIQHISWRTVFWVNLPIGAAAVAMIALFLKERVQHRQHQIDWIGSLLLLIAFGGLMLALVQGGSLDRTTFWTVAVIGGIALIALLIHEARIREPMLPLELWRMRVIVTGSLGSFGTGVAIATTCDAQGQPAGLTINSFSSVSLTPPMVLWSLSKTSSKYAAFQSGSHFCINILQKDQLPLAMQFSRHADDKFLNTAWEAGLGGAPKILGALATFECRNTVHYEGGDHTIFLGEVEAYAHHQGEPLLFHRGSFGGFLPS